MATLLEIDDLITQAATNPLYRRIRSAVRIFAQGKVRTGTVAEKAWAKDALVNTETWMHIMMPDFAATAAGVNPPFSTITDAQITTAVGNICPTYIV